MQTTEGNKVTAVFLSWQEVSPQYKKIGLNPFRLFNVVGGERDGSTVTDQTLLKIGVVIPETPTYEEWRKQSHAR